jgi:DNA-binding response OmpR family regulator
VRAARAAIDRTGCDVLFTARSEGFIHHRSEKATCDRAEVGERRPDLLVIMVTAYGDEERRRRASEHGADYITKAVDLVFLNTQLRQLPARQNSRASEVT